MDATMRAEAQEHIVSGIEKNITVDGIEVMLAAKFIKENMDR